MVKYETEPMGLYLDIIYHDRHRLNHGSSVSSKAHYQVNLSQGPITRNLVKVEVINSTSLKLSSFSN